MTNYAILNKLFSVGSQLHKLAKFLGPIQYS